MQTRTLWWWALALWGTAAASLAHSSPPIYRCGNSYGHTPCTQGASGAVLPVLPADTQPPSANPSHTPKPADRQRAPRAARHTLYHCQGRDSGEVFTSHTACGRQGAVTLKRSQDTASTQAPRKPQPERHRPGTARHAGSTDCDALNHRIQQLDTQARAGGSGTVMQRLRTERQAVRDRQFQQGC